MRRGIVANPTSYCWGVIKAVMVLQTMSILAVALRKSTASLLLISEET